LLLEKEERNKMADAAMQETTGLEPAAGGDIEHAAENVQATRPESALKSFISGGVGGACVVLVGHPLDLIKVRMQTGTAASRSVLGLLKQTFMKEGIRGLYRGVSAPLTAVSPVYAVNFWGYDMGKRVVQAWDKYMYGEVINPMTIPQLCFAGGFSAIPTTAFMAPSERIKCLLQVQQASAGPQKYSGMMDCARQVYKEGGMRSIFKGTTATLFRDVPGSIAWFGTYELTKRKMMHLQGIDLETGSLSPLAILSAGGLAGMACWTVAIPPDTIKSRYQTAPEGMYKGLGDVFVKLIREEGFGALFTGIRPALIRAFPANAACFFGMEVAREALAFMD
jgi:solute carrier family 25 carnitine/acylcarnitine transporter 20/29